MKFAIFTAGALYFVIAVGVFALHTQMPATLGLALLRSALWPLWFAGFLNGARLPMD